jgi:hypothetical protein
VSDDTMPEELDDEELAKLRDELTEDECLIVDLATQYYLLATLMDIFPGVGEQITRPDQLKGRLAEAARELLQQVMKRNSWRVGALIRDAVQFADGMRESRLAVLREDVRRWLQQVAPKGEVS